MLLSDFDFATFGPCVEIVTLTKYASVHLVLTEYAALFSSLIVTVYNISCCYYYYCYMHYYYCYIHYHSEASERLLNLKSEVETTRW